MLLKKICVTLVSILLFFSLLFGNLVVSFAEDESVSDPEALLSEGLKYFNGDGVDQDLIKGSSLILDAANSGSVNAMMQIAYLCAYGYGSSFYDDFEEDSSPSLALAWFAKVADVGEIDTAGYAIIKMGYDYLLGRNERIPENTEAAVMFFEKAEELGIYAANDVLGIFYTYGAIVDRDPDKALELLLEGFKNGYEDCGQYIEEYAYAYYAGTDQDIRINFSTAFKYYYALAELNNTRAMYNLGLLYIYGLGVSPNQEKGVEWIQKAADMGDKVAAEMLKFEFSESKS